MDASTIAAIATPAGKGGIGIVKISGRHAVFIAGALFRNTGSPAIPLESHRLYYGHIVDPDTGQAIDEVLLAVMRAPRTYTREDIVEINAHSGPVSLSRIPTTGHILAIWNKNPGANKRNPLTAAVSPDEGLTWIHTKNLEDAPDDAWAYPAVTWINNNAYITYFNYKGGISLFLKILPADWFYE